MVLAVQIILAPSPVFVVWFWHRVGCLDSNAASYLSQVERSPHPVNGRLVGWQAGGQSVSQSEGRTDPLLATKKN